MQNNKKEHGINIISAVSYVTALLGGVVLTYFVVVAIHDEIENRKAVRDAQEVSRVTKLYIENGDEVEKWHLDIDSKRNVFVGKVPHSEVDMFHRPKQKPWLERRILQ
jgi:hypothetical protein